MKKAVSFLMSMALMLTTGVVAVGNSVTVAADTTEKTMYDVSKDYPGVAGDYTPVVANNTGEWYYQALNTAGFFEYGALEQNTTTGALTTSSTNTTLMLFPMARDGNQGNGIDTTMADGSGTKKLDKLVQWQPGYGIGSLDSQIGKAHSLGGTVSASSQYCNIFGGQYVHPGTNLAVVYSFVVPRTGTVYFEDTVATMSQGGDGVRFAILHQPAAHTGINSFTWDPGSYGDKQITRGLYGAVPVYPTPKVAPAADGTGWQHVAVGQPFSYRTELYEVEQGDVIHFVLDAGGTITNDLTYFTPAIVYGERIDVLRLNSDSVILTAPSGTISGETYQLIPTIEPQESATKSVTYESLNENICTVDENGLITATGIGSTTVTATLVDGYAGLNGGNVTATIAVTVVSPEDSISILEEDKTYTLEQGYTQQFTYNIMPPSSSGKRVVWSVSSNTPETTGEEVVSVENGLVKALNPGTAIVRATVENGTAYDERTIVVTKAPAPTLSVSEASVSLSIGQNVSVTTGIVPLYHENATVQVDVLDDEIATAVWANGVITITGVKSGKTELIATVDGGNEVKMEIAVFEQAKKTYEWRNGFVAGQGPVWSYYMQKNGEEGYTELGFISNGWGAYEENLGVNVQRGTYTVKDADKINNAVDGTAHNQYLSIWNGQAIHPGYGYNAVIGFTAQHTGSLDFVSYFRVYNQASDGNNIKIMKGSTQVYPQEGEWAYVGYGQELNVEVLNISVNRGDVFYIVVNCHNENSFDWVYANPQFRYTTYDLDESITLDKTSVTLEVGGYDSLNPTIWPADSAKNILWSSSDSTVVSVSQYGYINALKEGTATIRVELESGTYAECVVTVVKKTSGDAKNENGCSGSIQTGVLYTTLFAAAIATTIIVWKKHKKKQ